MQKQNKLEVVNIRLVEGQSYLSGKPIKTKEDAIELIRKELSLYDREIFGVLNLTAGMRPINFNIVSMGTIKETLINPREFFKSIVLSNAAGVIAFHNHPSGNGTPSKEDIQVTRKLVAICNLMGVDFMDHIIVAGENITSIDQRLYQDTQKELGGLAADVVQKAEKKPKREGRSR